MKFVADPAKSYAGTCQACGRHQSLTKKLELVHHGYERPGDGYIVGDCAGVAHLPYELSCELSKVWAKSLGERIAVLQSELHNLAEDLVDVIPWQKTLTSYMEKEGYRPVRRRGGGIKGYEKLIFFEVKRDHIPSKAERDEKEAWKGWTGTVGDPGHDFAYYRKTRLGKLNAWIGQAQEDLAVLERRIREWVYAPEKLHTYEGTKTVAVVHWANDTTRPGRAACAGMRRRGMTLSSDPAKVTCTRCRTRL